ncbi:hypothetical protein ACROYT_G021715 [Oculina patagonica]
MKCLVPLVAVVLLAVMINNSSGTTTVVQPSATANVVNASSAAGGSNTNASATAPPATTTAEPQATTASFGVNALPSVLLMSIQRDFWTTWRYETEKLGERMKMAWPPTSLYGTARKLSATVSR